MTINLTNTTNQTLYFGIEWSASGRKFSDVVAIAYNQSHQFDIPSEGQSFVKVWQDADAADVFVAGSGTVINWLAGDYTGSFPPFVEGQVVNATYAGNNYSTSWNVVS